MLSAKSAVEQERHDVFKDIRHIVSTQHEAPKHLTLADLYLILATLKGKANVQQST